MNMKLNRNDQLTKLLELKSKKKKKKKCYNIIKGNTLGFSINTFLICSFLVRKVVVVVVMLTMG